MRFKPTLRAAAFSDAECLTALGIQVWLHTYATQGIRLNIARCALREFTPEYFRSVIRDPECHLTVAERNDHLLGYALTKMGDVCPGRRYPSTELVSLYVQEHFAGLGIGTSLLRQSESIAERRDDAVWLTVNAQNARAIAFYRQRGYQEIGEDYFELENERHVNYVFVQPSA